MLNLDRYKHTWIYKKAYRVKAKWLLFVKVFKQDYHAFKMALVYNFKKKRSPEIFFILCSPRTGSNLLYSYFNSVPGILCDGEILAPHDNLGMVYQKRAKEALRHIRHTMNYRECPIRGAKICLYQMDGHGLSLAELVAAFPDAHYFMLYREDILRQYLSQEIGFKTQKWVRTNPKAPLKLTKIKLDPENALRTAARIRARCKEVLEMPALKNRTIWISYEELVDNPQEVFDRKIFPLFKLPSSPVTTHYFKQNPFPISDIIENYDEVKDFIEKTNFQQHYNS